MTMSNNRWPTTGDVLSVAVMVAPDVAERAKADCITVGGDAGAEVRAVALTPCRMADCESAATIAPACPLLTTPEINAEMAGVSVPAAPIAELTRLRNAVRLVTNEPDEPDAAMPVSDAKSEGVSIPAEPVAVTPTSAMKICAWAVVTCPAADTPLIVSKPVSAKLPADPALAVPVTDTKSEAISLPAKPVAVIPIGEMKICANAVDAVPVAETPVSVMDFASEVVTLPT